MKAKFLISAAVVCMLLILTGVACFAGTIYVYNVKDYGAVGNGTTDDTTAFQNALTAAGNAGGGTVWAPAATYKIATHLNVPTYVTLAGEGKAPVGQYYAGFRTNLLASEGSGNGSGTPFIVLNAFSTLKGMTIYHPNQSSSSVVAYPWTIRGNGSNVSVIDTNLVNPYQGIDLGTNACPLHYIRGVYGQPLFRGIWIDNCQNGGRIENVHFAPLWASTSTSGVGLYIGRADGEFITDCYCNNYWAGYCFYAGSPNSTAANGDFTGIAAASCSFPLYFYAASNLGIHIADGQFSSASGGIGVYVEPTCNSDAVISFTNCTFNGLGTYGCYSYNGNLAFRGCTFKDWASPGWALVAQGGGLTTEACYFATSGNRISIAAAVTGAVVIGNQGVTAAQIANASTNYSIANNIP